MLRILFPLIVALAPPAHAAEWQANEQTKHYAVSGASGFALYQAIGENGPLIGPKGRQRRTIAHTTWDLKWRRDYRPDGSACVLRSAKPFVTIIYTLPKAKGALSPDVAARWKVFADGIAAHEKVHGDMIRAMVDTIIETTVGVRVENDAGCKKIRKEVLKRVKTAFDGYRAASNAFDREEMSGGGNVQRLILGLVRR